MQKVSKAYKESMKSSLRERAYIMISFGLVNQEAQAKATVDNGSYAYYSNKDNIFGEHIDDTVYATLEEEFTKVDGSMFFLPRATEGGRYYDTGIVSDKLISEARCEVIISLNTIATDFKGLTINFGENYPVDFDIVGSTGQTIVGKGIAFTRKRLLTHLRKYYAQHGSNEGYILLIDFSKYYDNIRHDVLLKLFEQYVDDEHALWLLRKTVERSRIDVSYMSDEEYEHCLDKLFDSLLYQYMNPKLFTGEKFMGKHLNIGDQVAQTAGISYRIRIDNYVKIVRGVKFYAGYMDDSYAIHESKEFLQELLEDIIEIANELGITVNTRKTRICKLSEHWRFLQVQYSLTDTGRVIQKINPKRLTAMRRKMKKLAPKLTEKEFTEFYKSWFKNHYKIMSKKQGSNMDTLFNQLKEVTKCTLSPLPMAKS